MSTTTKFLGLTKPADNETADIQVINANMDLLDAKAGKSNLYNANTSATDDYAIALTGITSFTELVGIPLSFKATVANTTAATLNINSLGAKAIVRGTGTGLVTGDIIANKMVTVIFDGTNFQLMSQGADVVQLDATQTLANKTLTAPKLASGGYIADANGNELIKSAATVPGAVNEVTVSNAATGTAPSLSATGGDTNINFNLIPKGTGRVQEKGVNLVNNTEFTNYQNTVNASLADIMQQQINLKRKLRMGGML